MFPPNYDGSDVYWYINTATLMSLYILVFWTIFVSLLCPRFEWIKNEFEIKCVWILCWIWL